MPIISKLEIYGIALLVIALAMGAAYFKGKHEGMAEVQQKYDLFVAQVNAAGEKAKADALQKEKENDAKITAANTSRDSALARLRDAQASANAGRRILSGIPTSASSPDKICFSRAKFESAFGTLNTDLQGLTQRGDTAIIDNKAWLSSWPSASPQQKQ